MMEILLTASVRLRAIAQSNQLGEQDYAVLRDIGASTLGNVLALSF